MKVLLSILGLLLSASAIANDYQSIVRNAFEAIHLNFDGDWSFTESATTDDGVTVGRYDVLSPADGGPIVPIAVDTRVKGRAMLVIKFDETETIRYSDFEYAVREEEMVPVR